MLNLHLWEYHRCTMHWENTEYPQDAYFTSVLTVFTKYQRKWWNRDMYHIVGGNNNCYILFEWECMCRVQAGRLTDKHTKVNKAAGTISCLISWSY